MVEVFLFVGGEWGEGQKGKGKSARMMMEWYLSMISNRQENGGGIPAILSE